VYDGVSGVVWRVSAYAIARRDGRVLVMEPVYPPGRWDLPGGGVDPGETLAEGVTRECWEETGHRFVAAPGPVVHFLGEARFYLEPALEPAPSPYRHSLLFAVEGTANPDPAWQGAPGETRRVAWIDPGELSERNVHPKHWLALALAGLVRVSDP